MTLKKTAAAAATISIAWLILGGLSPAPAHEGSPDMMDGIDCARCHYCPDPSGKDPCLKPCPTMTASVVKGKHELSEAPDSIVLGFLADLYEPVRFDHKAHAGMAEMGLKCGTCHHYSPEDDIPPCRECHGGEANPNNLRQPGLKGAYHRQCLSCHREWSHETQCVICHLPAEGKMIAAAMDTTDILGVDHPAIHVPEKRIYNTPYRPGPVVTFHHEDHVELYGLSCATCHQDENCSRCHDMNKPALETMATDDPERMKVVHGMCNNCHEDDACAKCHDTKEKPGFTHASTGWPLNRFHAKLGCRSCHPTGRPISRLDRQCQACHGGWNRDNFDHAVTGLRLDEMHGEFECENCHVESRFDRKPACTECHEEEMDPRYYTPGEYIRR